MDHFDQFAAYETAKKKSALTVSAYTTDILEFMYYIKKDALEIAQKDIGRYVEYLKTCKNQKGVLFSIKTINRKMVSINRFILYLNDMHGMQILAKAPVFKIQQQNYLDDVISKSDFDRIVRAADKKNDTRAKAIFYTLYYTGMRVSEMLQLQLEDVEKETINVRGKGDKYRDIFISDKLKALWNEYRKDRRDNSKMFFTGERGPITRQTASSIIKYYAGQARVKLTKAHAHSFRHLFCLTLVEKGMSIDTVADLAGHSNINTTRIYTRKTKKQLLAAINEM